jgi:hypothetical protein
MGLFIDHDGACLVGKGKSMMTLGNFRQGCDKMLETLPAAQQEMVAGSMHALDEVDFLRISQWATIEAFRPTRARGPATKLLAIEDGSPQSTWKTKAEFYAENEEVPCTELAIPTPGVGHGWICANSECTFGIAMTGAMPALEYERCRMEPRRERLLLCRMDQSEPTLVKMVELAVLLCTEGALPPYQKKYRYMFLLRCTNALAKAAPGAKCIPSELGASDQRRISYVLDGHTAPFDGCFGCMDAEPEWHDVCPGLRDKPLTAEYWAVLYRAGAGVRCVKCNTPQSHGRRKEPIWDLVSTARGHGRRLTWDLESTARASAWFGEESEFGDESDPMDVGSPTPKRRRV